jgi:polyisoprenyl-phosphate glycosyltransferase
MSANTPAITVSIVVPVYSGENYLAALADEVAAVRAEWAATGAPVVLAELVFVDDAAVDRSAEVLTRLAAQHSWIRVIHLSRNFGQHPATVAGILHSSGDWVATLDEDLQHPPAKLGKLLREAGLHSFDVVYGRPTEAVHESAFRDGSSALSKRLLAMLTGNPHVRHFSSFRLMRGSIARAVGSVCGPESYFDVVLFWFTQRVGVVHLPMKDQRVIGKGRSGYTLLKLLSHGRRMLLSSGIKAIRVGALVGVVSVAASVLLSTAVLVAELIHPGGFAVRGWASLFIAILFFSGVVIFMLGIALEYLVTLVMRAQGKPTFFSVDRSSDRLLADHFRE